MRDIVKDFGLVGMMRFELFNAAVTANLRLRSNSEFDVRVNPNVFKLARLSGSSVKRGKLRKSNVLLQIKTIFGAFFIKWYSKRR